MPKKVFVSDRRPTALVPLAFPAGTTVRSALDRVLRLLSVGSKRFLTNKVDRSVTGLIAQQQCVGPLHTPLADVAVVALSHFDTKGGATSIGEQPIVGLVDVASGARMAVAESLTNLVWVRSQPLKRAMPQVIWDGGGGSGGGGWAGGWGGIRAPMRHPRPLTRYGCLSFGSTYADVRICICIGVRIHSAFRRPKSPT